MITKNHIVPAGRFNKPHGVNGEISASFDFDTEMLQDLQFVVVEIDGIMVPFNIVALRPKSFETALLQLEDVDNEKEAKQFSNVPFYITMTEYVKLIENNEGENADELPLSFFIDFSIVDTDGCAIGKIVDVDDSTANMLFVVENEKKTRFMVPAVDDLIVEMDFEEKNIVMNLPEGILEL